MKGIVLAAGKGTRLYPMTKPVCKPLLPVYDKPLIYYPIAILMQAGISEILVIVPPNETATFTALLGDGSQYGLKISYAEQPVPRGIADALLIGQEFVGDDRVCLVLGDNIFYAPTLGATLKKAAASPAAATVFGYYVEDPRPFGVVEFDKNGKAISIEEKPRYPKSNYIVPGLYFYDQQVMEIARALKPSARGELEITDVNRMYLEEGSLEVKVLHRGSAWLDTGTIPSLYKASEFVKAVEDNQGLQIASLEEIAYNNGWITKEVLLDAAERHAKTAYGQHLLRVAENRILFGNAAS